MQCKSHQILTKLVSWRIYLKRERRHRKKKNVAINLYRVRCGEQPQPMNQSSRNSRHLLSAKVL